MGPCTGRHRANRLVQNDIENVYMAFALFWAGVICFGFSTNPGTLVHIIGVVGFTVFRCLHTFFYGKLKKQPPRTASFALGQVCLMVVAFNALAGVM